MDPKFWMYLAYLAISIGLTIWVATTLSRNGLLFLEDVFANARLAKAVNHLLVVGFYLLNLGFVAVAMTSRTGVPDANRALETLSMKIGLVLLVLGALHFTNVFLLNRYRRGRLRQQEGRPPLPPAGRLPGPPPRPGPMPAGPHPSGRMPGLPPPAGPMPGRPMPGSPTPPPAPA